MSGDRAMRGDRTQAEGNHETVKPLTLRRTLDALEHPTQTPTLSHVSSP